MEVDMKFAFRSAVYAVAPADVQRIAAMYIERDTATIVVAGDQKTIAEELAPYGKAPTAH
jgi:predicted Zn-dependent peptidase